MKRKTVQVSWEDEDFQKCFAEWVPFPDELASAQDLDRIEALLDLSAPKDVLDVGCGNGRHAIELARRGYRVVGIDIAARFLAQARKAAKASRLAIEFRQQRASELVEKDAFDFALAYWHTIGFMSEEEIKKHFSSICEALRPTCPLLYVFQGPKMIPDEEKDGQSTRNWGEKDGKFILSKKEIRDGYRAELSIVIDTNTCEITEYQEHQRAFSYEEVMEILREAGFVSVEAYKDFDKTPASQEDFSMFVCWR